MRIKPQALIGVELGANSVRIIKTDKKSRVIRAGRIELSAVKSPDEEQTPQEITKLALKRAKKAARVGGGKCVLCLSGSDIILRNFSMPNMDEQALKINIAHEIQDFIAGDKYYVTHKIHSFSTNADGSVQLNVLVAAVLQEKVDEQVKLLRSAGFKPVVVDVCENSREKLLNYITGGKNLPQFLPPKPLPPKKKKSKNNKKKKAKTVEKKVKNTQQAPPDVNAAVITFGTAYTSVTIVLGRRFYVSRYLNTGTGEIIARIAEAEGVDTSRAAEVFAKGDFFGERSDSPAASQVKHVLDTLGAEITSVIDYSFYRERSHRVDKIYASGPITRLEGATPYLEELFGIPVVQMDGALVKHFKKRARVTDVSPYINVLGATLREVR